MAEEAGNEFVAVLHDHLKNVKSTLSSRSNMVKTLKEEAIMSVREMETILNKLSGMFLGLESSLRKALSTPEVTATRMYSDVVATSSGPPRNHQLPSHLVAPPFGNTPKTSGLIVKTEDQHSTSHELKTLIKESLDPKALQLGVNNIRNLTGSAVFVECHNRTDCETMERELKKVKGLTVERPKRRLPTLIIKHVPKDIEDPDIKDIILHQNNLSQVDEPLINVKFTKRTFNDSRHIVIEVSPTLWRKLIGLEKIKIKWSMCRVENFIVVTRCMRCLAFGHTSKFCHNEQKCSICAGDHQWKNCNKQQDTCCSNCLKANTYIHDNTKKLNTNHSAFDKECPRLRRIEQLIINKTDY